MSYKEVQTALYNLSGNFRKAEINEQAFLNHFIIPKLKSSVYVTLEQVTLWRDYNPNQLTEIIKVVVRDIYWKPLIFMIPLEAFNNWCDALRVPSYAPR